jgi:hypothetical protein
MSADGGSDDIYAFSHSNDRSHSIWIVLYLGGKRKVEDGRKVIEGFKSSLSQSNYLISDSAILTSEEEEKIERESEAGEEQSREANRESIARFALGIYCSTLAR